VEKDVLSWLKLKRSGCYLTDVIRISSKREAEMCRTFQMSLYILQ